MSKSYMDIGHGLDADHAAIWKLSWRDPVAPDEYSRSYIEYRSARKHTHETAWGRDVLKCWRGRYDIKTKQVSVVSPEGNRWTSKDVPKTVVNNLVIKFGEDIQIWQFPAGRKIR